MTGLSSHTSKLTPVVFFYIEKKAEPVLLYVFSIAFPASLFSSIVILLWKAPVVLFVFWYLCNGQYWGNNGIVKDGREEDKKRGGRGKLKLDFHLSICWFVSAFVHRSYALYLTHKELFTSITWCVKHQISEPCSVLKEKFKCLKGTVTRFFFILFTELLPIDAFINLEF